MLVHHPHDLGSVHGRTAADRNDDVGSEVAHLPDAFVRAGERGIGRDVEEGRMRDALCVEDIGDLLGEAALIEESVGDDERLLLIVDLMSEFLEGNSEASALEIDLFGSSEPQHIFLPFRNGFVIDEVLDADVLRDGVAAPRAAAEGERRRHLEVVKIADTAVRRRRVDDDTAGLHDGAEALDLVLTRLDVDIERGGVAKAAILDEAVCLGDGVLEVLRLVHCKHGRELLVRELFGDVDGLDFTDKHFAALGRREARKFCDLAGALADDLRVERAVDDDGLSHLVRLFGGEEVSAAERHLLLELVVDVFEDDDRLLGSADHAVIERLGVQDGGSRELDVRRGIDDGGRVACADANCGLAGGVCRLDHAGTARRKDEVRLSHDHARKGHGGLIDPADDVFGGTRFDCRLEDDLRRFDRTLLCTGMGRDDERVPRL